MKVAYLLKKFPRLSETFILNELLGQQALGLDLVVLSRREPDDEPRHPQLQSLRAPVEVLPPVRTLDPWKGLFQPNGSQQDPLQTWAGLASAVPALIEAGAQRLDRLVAEALYVLERCKALGIDHLHVHFATDSALVAHLVHALGGPTYSITAHAKDIYRSTVSPAGLSHLFEHSAFVITVCDANVHYLAERLTPAALARVRRLYNGIDLEAFPYRRDERASAQVLAVGRLVAKKGIDLLLHATRLLLDRGETLTVTLLGDGEERAALEAQSQSLGLQEHVQFLGAQPQDVVRRAMQTATLFCLPCRIGPDGNRDALPTVLLEALSMGLPCISTPVTGIPEILDEGRAGCLVPEESPEDLALALQRMLHHPELCEEYAARGRRRAERLFNGHTSALTLFEAFAEQTREVSTP